MGPSRWHTSAFRSARAHRALLRIRAGLIGARTILINETRGLLKVIAAATDHRGRCGRKSKAPRRIASTATPNVSTPDGMIQSGPGRCSCAERIRPSPSVACARGQHLLAARGRRPRGYRGGTSRLGVAKRRGPCGRGDAPEIPHGRGLRDLDLRRCGCAERRGGRTGVRRRPSRVSLGQR